MKTKSRWLASVLCLALVALCIVGLAACSECSHEYGEWTTTKEATCTEAGEKTRVCAKCEEIDSSTIDALGHDWAEATCSQPKTCKTCSLTEGEAKGHSYTVEAVKDEALKSAATATSAAVYYKSCACGAISTSDADTFTSGDPLGHVHSYTVESATANTLKAAANCENGTVYYKSCACGDIATSDEHTFVVGDALGHKDENLDHECDNGCGKENIGAHTDSATDGDHLCDYGCLGVVEDCFDKAGDDDHDCDVCGKVDVTSHQYGNATCGAPATCTECGATTGTTLDHKDDNHDHNCDNGCGKNDMGIHADSATDNDHVCDYGCLAVFGECSDVLTDNDHKCDVCGKENVTTHVYVQTDATPATCEDAATETYTCNCGHSYDDVVGAALDHDITGVTPTERPVANCGVELVYECQRANCGKEVVGETVYRHTYVASISTPATCSEDGVKTFACSVCGDTSKANEPIPADATGHNWESVSTVGNVRTDECSHCHEERTVTVYTGTTADNLTKDDLKEEIEVNNANISLDSGVLDKIGDQNVSVSADTLDDTAREALLDENQLVQVGDSPIYNFTISNGSENISDFGEGNFVTITLPYTLAEGEDVDSIAVWFINDEGALESIEATYNNGFVTFKTNHFSYYTVTRLTPAERCALYGHGYVCKHVDGSCTKDSYDLYVCVRCHHQYTENYVVADGHDYTPDEHPATCTENGYTLYTCDDCGHAYRITQAASGHSFALVDSDEASCTQDGFAKYACGNCGEEYTITEPKLAHAYTDTVVPATCTADGYTRHECDNCGYSYTDGHTEALGHEYEAGEWSWESNGNKAFLNFVCTHDGAHATSIRADMDKVVTKGECSNYVIRTHTATVVFNGETYTDVKVIRQGNPQHTFSDAWTRDENSHWHECICGARKDEAAHSYENATTTKNATCAEDGELSSYCVCGKVHVDIIPATGEHTYVDGFCSECGAEYVDTYYLNLVSSWKETNGFAIKVENLSFEMKRKDPALLDSLKVIASLKQIDVAELCLFVEDGALGGAATGTLEFYDNYFVDEGKYKFDAVIEDGYIFLRVLTGESLNNAIYKKISVEAAIGTMMEESVEIPEEAIAILTSFASDVVLPALSSFVEANAEGIDELLGSIFNIFFTFEEQDDGSVVATLDYDKLYALNENLATKTIAEVVDIYFGEGAFDALVAWVEDTLALTLPELPAFVDSLGIDSEALIEKINAIAAASGAEEGYDIVAILESEEFAGVTLGNLIFSYADDYTAEIASYVALLREGVLYDMLAENADEAKAFKDMVDAAIAPFAESAVISFTTEASGMLSEVALSADAFTLDAGREIVLTLDLTIAINEKIDVAWSEIVEEINENVVLPEEAPESNVHFDYWYAESTIVFRDTEYRYNGYILLYAYEPIPDMPDDITFGADCTGWMWYEIQFAARRQRFEILPLATENGATLIRDMYGNRVAMLIPSDDGTTATVLFEDGTEKTIPAPAPQQNPTEDEIANLYLTLCLSVFEDAEGKISHFDAYSEYYYNAETGEYADDTQHALDTHHELLGETCEDGRRVTITCANCDYRETHTANSCEYSEKRIDLSAQGACAGTTATVYGCEHCGEVWESYIRLGCAFNDDATHEDVLDEDGNVVGEAYAHTCSNCGLVYVEKYWTEPTGTCTYKSHYDTYAYLNDLLVYSNEEYSSGANHDYECTYELEGETCEDGYTVIMTCTVCNEVHTDYGWGHATEEKMTDLSALGFCDGTVLYENICAVCDAVVNHDFAYSCCWSLSDTMDDGRAYIKCENCGGGLINNVSHSDKDENCYYYETNHMVFIVNGEEIFCSESSYRRQAHKYQIETVLFGESCTDGVNLIRTCADCDYYAEETYSSHRVNKDLSSDDLDVCYDHQISIVSCACGEQFHFDYHDWSFEYDEDTDEYHCDACGLTVVDRMTVVEEGCQLIEKTTLSVALAGEILVSRETEHPYANHHYSNLSAVIVDGVTTLTCTCDKCGDTLSTELFSCEMEEHEGEWYYDYVFTPDASGIYTITGLADRDTYVTVYKMVNGLLEYIGYNDDGNYYNAQFLFSSHLEAGETYVYRIGFYNYDEEGTIAFGFGAGTPLQNSSCSHNYKQFSVLPEGATSCEDGVLSAQLCATCGALRPQRFVYDHITFETNRIDFREFGACYGDIREYACACGEVSELTYSHCAWQYTSNEFDDEEGRHVYNITEKCPDCGLHLSNEYYTAKEGCTVTEYHTLVVYLGDVLVWEKEYTVSREEHAYEYSGVLEEGATSCEEGVIITRTCKDCGASYSYTTHYHENFVKERIDLSQCGSVCGGYAVVQGCACGVSNSLKLEPLCDLYHEWHEGWVDGALEGSQETILGYAYFNQTASLRICAVTDPEQCPFKIRYANYWKKVEGECYAIHYETWQLGYNEETGEYLYEVTFQTSEPRVYHDYVETENGYSYECPDCGSYVHNSYSYDEATDTNRQETEICNTLNDGNDKLYQYVEEWSGTSSYYYEKRVHADDSEYWYERSNKTLPYDEAPFGEDGRLETWSERDSNGYNEQSEHAYVHCAGHLYFVYTYVVSGDYWYRYDYSYSFDGECLRTEVYTNSNGGSSTETYSCCYFYGRETVKAPTCTQDGEYYEICDVCGKHSESYTTSALGHDWVELADGWHFCYRCHLENQNGANGAIDLEDLTEAYGNGENYVVGYNVRTYVEFSQYVSLILANGDEIICTGIDIFALDGVRAYAFSKAAVDAWAAENGYTDYDVRFAFVPNGMDGSLDYAITFADALYSGTVEGNVVGRVSFTEYVGEGETKRYTIAPTEDALWLFASFVDRNSPVHVTLYDAEENWLDYNYGNNLLLLCELKAGEIYYVDVRWLSAVFAGEVPLLFAPNPSIPE